MSLVAVMYIVRGRNIIVGDVTDLIEDNPELKGLVGYLTDVDDDGHIYYYGYGKGFNTLDSDSKGLFKITRNANAEQQIITRLRVAGSSKNLPYRYYNEKYGLPQTMFVTNLQLPDTFLPYSGVTNSKTAGNTNRDAIYGVDPITGIPYIRQVAIYRRYILQLLMAYIKTFEPQEFQIWTPIQAVQTISRITTMTSVLTKY